MKPARTAGTRIREPRVKEGRKSDKGGNSSVEPAARASGRAHRLPVRLAAYALSAHDPRELPPPGVPEIAFVGRSNSGKSSAINTLAGRRRLAFVSKTPGRTQLINFFSLGDSAYLVDLPGYGFAGVPAAVREHWDFLVGGYVAERASLAGVIIVMDARHPLTPLDERLIEWLRDAGRGAHILLTKADKLSRQSAQATLARVRARAATLLPGMTVQLFSSLKGEGVDEALEALTRFARAKNKSPG